MNRLLIVNVNWVGDVLFSTPAIRALRKKFPDSYIACLVPKRCAAILENNPYLNEVISIEDRRPFLSPLRVLKLIKLLRQRKFDGAICFHRSRTRTFLCLLGGISYRLGYARQPETRFLTHIFPLPRKPLHKTDYFLNLLTALGVSPDGRHPDYFPPAGCKNPVDASKGYVVIHAGGNWGPKRWPAEHFAEWLRLFSARYPQMKIVLCGQERERTLIEQILKMANVPNAISLAGKTSTGELALILRDAAFLLSNDSGPIHLAASQRTPIVGLFGPTRPDLTGPLSLAPVSILSKDVGCETPCYFSSCDTRVCLEWVTPQEVFNETVKLLSQR